MSLIVGGRVRGGLERLVLEKTIQWYQAQFWSANPDRLQPRGTGGGSRCIADVRGLGDDVVMTPTPMTRRQRKNVEVALAALEARVPRERALARAAEDEDTRSIQAHGDTDERAVDRLRNLPA